jgi:DNA polymerase III gamma/tau subunit
MLGLEDSITEMLLALSEKDAKRGIKVCLALDKQGADFRFFIEKLIEKLHFMLLVQVGLEKGESLFSLEQIQKLFNLLSDAHSETKSAVLPQTPLEVVIIEWVGEDSVPIKTTDVLNESSFPTERNEKSSSSQAINKSEKDFFSKLIDEVKVSNNLFAGVLRGCKGEIKNGDLVIYASSKFHKDKISEPKNSKLIEDATEKLGMKNIKINIVLKEVNKIE